MHHTAVSLGRAHAGLQHAFIELAQLDERMPKELSEYLREETYEGLTSEQLIHGFATILAGMQEPMKKLSEQVSARSSDLQRLGVGDSFSV